MTRTASTASAKVARASESQRQGKPEQGSQHGPAAGQGGRSRSPAPVEVREAFWLQELRQGQAISEIADRAGLTPRRIRMGLERARLREQSSRLRESQIRDGMQGQERASIAVTGHPEWEDPRHVPRLVPLFPIGSFTPHSTCPHHGPIRQGSVFCCMVCSRSGMDEHPALKRNPLTDPRPEAKKAPVPTTARRPETRKQRRRRLFSERSDSLAQDGADTEGQ